MKKRLKILPWLNRIDLIVEGKVTYLHELIHYIAARAMGFSAQINGATCKMWWYEPVEERRPPPRVKMLVFALAPAVVGVVITVAIAVMLFAYYKSLFWIIYTIICGIYWLSGCSDDLRSAYFTLRGRIKVVGHCRQRESDMLGKVEHTSRGFEVIYFKDYYNTNSSLQQSGLPLYEPPDSSAIWLGVDESRMHLVQEQVKDLVALLQNWLDTGSFESGSGD